MISKAEENKRIISILQEFKDIKEIAFEINLDRRLTATRIWHLGYRKCFISDEERRHLMERRKKGKS